MHNTINTIADQVVDMHDKSSDSQLPLIAYALRLIHIPYSGLIATLHTQLILTSQLGQILTHPSMHGMLVPCAPSRWACLTLDDSTAPTCLCHNRFWPTCSPLTLLGSLTACLRGPNPILDIWQLPSLFLQWSTTMLKLELRMLMAFPLVSFNFAMLIKPF